MASLSVDTPSGITTFTYDANGNTEVENLNGQLTTYTWDIENMCVGIALPDGTRNTFAYDADLKRRQAEDSSGLAQLINDLENVLLETDAGGSTQVAYTLEPQTYGNLISQRRSGGTSWHHFDGLGSTERLTDVGQAALATYLNTAFGVPVVATGNHPNRLRYKGRIGYRFEADMAEYDIRRRRLRPARGRWVSRDPVFVQSKMYAYVSNNPASMADPAGLVGGLVRLAEGQRLVLTSLPIADWYTSTWHFGIKRVEASAIAGGNRIRVYALAEFLGAGRGEATAEGRLGVYFATGGCANFVDVMLEGTLRGRLLASSCPGPWDVSLGLARASVDLTWSWGALFGQTIPPDSPPLGRKIAQSISGYRGLGVSPGQVYALRISLTGDAEASGLLAAGVAEADFWGDGFSLRQLVLTASTVTSRVR